MMREQQTSRFFLVTLGIVLVLLVILCLRIFRDWNDVEAALARVPPIPEVPVERQVKLANRTLILPVGKRNFPSHWASLQTPTARGTVPFILVSEAPVSKVVREKAEQDGARVLGYLPVNALLVEVDAKALQALKEDVLFAGAFEFSPEDKVQQGLLPATQPLQIVLVPLSQEDLSAIAEFLVPAGATLLETKGRGGCVRAIVPPSLVPTLAHRGDVRWIERDVPPKFHNSVAVKPGLMNVQPICENHGLTGRGQYITCADSGLDSGDPATVMDDFQGRVVAIHPTVPDARREDLFGHGTHVAGSLVGTGARSNGEIKGVAPGARLWMWGCATDAGDLYFPDWGNLFQPETNICPAYVHSESWGNVDESFYTVECQSVDRWIWSHAEHLVVFSAGNAGDKGLRTISDPAGAKNVLAVGATESVRLGNPYSGYADNASQIAFFSARGPMRDGRIKPDLCAPGTMILSTRTREIPPSETVGWLSYSNTNYTYNSGTSMATPLVAGAATLVREWLVGRRGYTNELPTAALLKAILMGGAYDMSGDARADCGGTAPNNHQGWGRVDLGETLYPSNRAVRLFDRIPYDHGSETVFSVTTTNAAPLDVQLVWLDYPAEPAAAQSLIDDLDLVVSNETTGAVWWGNGIFGGDRTNNVESIRLERASVGRYSIRVRGIRVPYASTEGGAAALYVRGAFEGSVEMAFREEPENALIPVCYRSRFPLLDDWGATESAWVSSGQVVRVSIPADLPDGSERLVGLEWRDDVTGQKRLLDEQRLAEVAVDGEVEYDEKGRMPRVFDVKVETATEIQFRYYGVQATNEVQGLPEWWYRRYLAGATAGTELGLASADADGDGVSNAAEYAADTDPLDPDSVFRILALTPSNLIWRGGCERTQVVERTSSLGAKAVWTGVFTNVPPTAVENACELPKESHENSFYRIRAF